MVESGLELALAYPVRFHPPTILHHPSTWHPHHLATSHPYPPAFPNQPNDCSITFKPIALFAYEPWTLSNNIISMETTPGSNKKIVSVDCGVALVSHKLNMNGSKSLESPLGQTTDLGKYQLTKIILQIWSPVHLSLLISSTCGEESSWLGGQGHTLFRN